MSTFGDSSSSAWMSWRSTSKYCTEVVIIRALMRGSATTRTLPIRLLIGRSSSLPEPPISQL